MFFTALRRSLWPRSAYTDYGKAVRVVVTTLLFFTPLRAFAQAASGFENPPVLKVTELIPANLLKGKGFQVNQNVPTDGVMGTFTLTADAATFPEYAGTYQVRSGELFRIRLAEIPAIEKLNEMSKVGVFAKSMATTAVRPLEAAGNMVLNPVATVKGVPSGVGRLFDRVELGASSLWDSATAPDQSGMARAGNVADRAGTVTANALGYEQVRRDLAKQLGVDPYTSNPILTKKLDDMAWVAFAGRVGVNTAISVAVPASMIITGTTVTDNLVWDTPRADLIVRVETKLQEMNVPLAQISTFTHNPAIPLSLQVAVVENLGRLVNVPGRANVVGLMGGAITESQARFVATSLRMLADYHEKQQPLTAIAAPGPLAGRNQDGALILPAPVDYVSWTERVASFVQSPAFVAVQPRTVWLAGKMSPLAKKEFEANGWTIHEGTAP